MIFVFQCLPKNICNGVNYLDRSFNLKKPFLVPLDVQTVDHNMVNDGICIFKSTEADEQNLNSDKQVIVHKGVYLLQFKMFLYCSNNLGFNPLVEIFFILVFEYSIFHS